MGVHWFRNPCCSGDFFDLHWELTALQRRLSSKTHIPWHDFELLQVRAVGLLNHPLRSIELENVVPLLRPPFQIVTSVTLPNVPTTSEPTVLNYKGATLWYNGTWIQKRIGIHHATETTRARCHPDRRQHNSVEKHWHVLYFANWL